MKNSKSYNIRFILFIGVCLLTTQCDVSSYATQNDAVANQPKVFNAHLEKYNKDIVPPNPELGMCYARALNPEIQIEGGSGRNICEQHYNTYLLYSGSHPRQYGVLLKKIQVGHISLATKWEKRQKQGTTSKTDMVWCQVNKPMLELLDIEIPIVTDTNTIKDFSFEFVSEYHLVNSTHISTEWTEVPCD